MMPRWVGHWDRQPMTAFMVSRNPSAEGEWVLIGAHAEAARVRAPPFDAIENRDNR